MVGQGTHSSAQYGVAVGAQVAVLLGVHVGVAVSASLGAARAEAEVEPAVRPKTDRVPGPVAERLAVTRPLHDVARRGVHLAGGRAGAEGRLHRVDRPPRGVVQPLRRGCRTHDAAPAQRRAVTEVVPRALGVGGVAGREPGLAVVAVGDRRVGPERHAAPEVVAEIAETAEEVSSTASTEAHGAPEEDSPLVAPGPEPTPDEIAAAKALMKTAQDHHFGKRFAEARDVYQEVIDKYGTTKQAATARQQLDNLKKA